MSAHKDLLTKAQRDAWGYMFELDKLKQENTRLKSTIETLKREIVRLHERVLVDSDDKE